VRQGPGTVPSPRAALDARASRCSAERMRDGLPAKAGAGSRTGQRLRHVVAGSLVSVAGLIGRPVRDGQGDIGRVADIVVHSDHDYPTVAGIIARLGLRRVRIDADRIHAIGQRGVDLSSSVVDLRRREPGDGEMLLVRHVLDHQMVDVDGVRVVRAADLYLALLNDSYALVGADVSVRTVLRRALPGRARLRPSPDLVLDWAQVQPFGHPDGRVRLRDPHAALHALHPAQLAELLADLGCRQQQELLAALGNGHAARALGHLDRAHRRFLLRALRPEHAARLTAELDPAAAPDAPVRTRRWPWHPHRRRPEGPR